MTDPSTSLTALIRQLESRIDAEPGDWPEEFFLFVSRVTPLVNVDLLIQDGDGRTLLTWRSDQFFGPGWHVPGGIIRHKEAAADRVHAVARRELGTAVTFDPAPILVSEHIRSDRQDRAHAVSLLYRCRLAGELDPHRRHAPHAPVPGQWQWHDKCPTDLIAEQRSYAALMR